jgi:hypothetical protein
MEQNMRFFMKSRLLVLAGIAVLVIGIAGCDPGPNRWPGASANTPLHAEAKK